MIVFPCQICQTPLSADDAQAGKLVACPNCSTTLRVPQAVRPMAEPARVAAGGPRVDLDDIPLAPPPTAPPPPPPSPSQQSFQRMGGFRPGGGKRYGFNCGYCSSRLEATE